MESILQTVKKLLGITDEYKVFDTDLMIHINSVLSVLRQIGVGPENGFVITGDSETWNDYLGDDPRLETVKTYVYLKVKTIFDPPTSSIIAEATNRMISELEWRINVDVDPKVKE